jgi:hypothetical protein
MVQVLQEVMGFKVPKAEHAHLILTYDADLQADTPLVGGAEKVHRGQPDIQRLLYY